MNPAFLVIDKPAGITSHDVVAMVRAVTGLKKVGHTGTLDPFATGVLPLALGAATRLISFLDEDLKIYDARVQLGSATDTGDPTGTVVRTAEVPELTDARIAEALAGFRGVRMQARLLRLRGGMRMQSWPSAAMTENTCSSTSPMRMGDKTRSKFMSINCLYPTF